MGCCIALALVVAVVRTVWFRLVRRGEPVRPSFAPPAVRLGPGHIAGDTRTSGQPPTGGRGTAGVGRSHRVLPSPMLAVLATLVGAGVYAELLAVLARTGAVVADTGTPLWRTREAALIGAGIAAAVAASALGAHRAERAHRLRRLGVTLLAAGGAWAFVSVLDMHLTGLVPAHHVSPPADLALHGPGLLALTAGALLIGSQRTPAYTGATS